MKNTLKKTLSLIIVVVILITTYISVQAADDGGGGESETGVLKIAYDTAKPRHQALTMTVDPVDSQSPIQAFCVGWTFKFISLKDDSSIENRVINAFVPLSDFKPDGEKKRYTFPLTSDWTGEYTGIADGKSIRDMILDDELDSDNNNLNEQIKYDSILHSNFIVLADACIQKYSYRNGKYTPLDTFANSKWDIDEYFSEFSPKFKTNTKDNYFVLRLLFDPELITSTVTLKDPPDGLKINKGESFTITGVATHCKTVDVLINGIFYHDVLLNGLYKTFNCELDTATGYYKEYNVKTTYTATETGDYDVQLRGYDANGEQIFSKKHTVHVVAPEPETGNINIRCRLLSDNSIISSSTIPNVPYDTAKTITAPTLQGYQAKGSYSSYSSSTPSSSVMQAGVMSQTVTLSSTNQNAYLDFWYDEVQGPVAIIDGPTQVKAGNDFTLSGSRSYCKQAGAKIVDYKWSVPITGVSGTTSFGTPGIYTVTLTVTDSNGLTDTTQHEVEVTPPTPSASISTSGKIKENRKITVSGRNSSSPERYPINWSRTTWKIEPDLATGADWDFGVRLEDGTVYKYSNGKALKYDNDTWVNTGISFNTILNEQRVFDFQARNAGTYKVTIYIENSYPASDTYNGVIMVKNDESPVASCLMQEVNLREYDNPLDNTKQKFAIMPIISKSYSPDGDTIVKHIWGYRWNSQNNADSNGNPILTDDITVSKYQGNVSDPFLPDSGQRLILDNDNDTSIEIWTYDVGMYYPELIVEEGILDNETIKELLLPSDIRRTTINGGW